ncbi:MAG: helix-turn-helix domain-containing protein, partial [Pseudomonadota bacterium]|nr:helix-turn-helix domain-containing protein [Pseudomonadota bacterium]
MPQPQENADISPTTDGRLARGEATRERVLDAAERCFAAKGFEAVSIRQIAAEAEVTLGVVGFHGGSKEELFMTVFSRRAAT